MQKKTAALIAFISMGAFTVLSFIRIIFIATSGRWDYHASMFTGNRFLPILILLCAVLAIAALIMHFANKKSDLLKYMTYAPFAAAALFVLHSAIIIMSQGYFEYTPAWGFYVECALLIAACVLTYMIMAGKTIEAEEPAPVPAFAPSLLSASKTNASKVNGVSLEDLKKYRELKDEGIITAEEYAAKAREMLGLDSEEENKEV